MSFVLSLSLSLSLLGVGADQRPPPFLPSFLVSLLFASLIVFDPNLLI